jgi:hypothetical protein
MYFQAASRGHPLEILNSRECFGGKHSMEGRGGGGGITEEQLGEHNIH